MPHSFVYFRLKTKVSRRERLWLIVAPVPTIFTHAVAAAALITAFPPTAVPRRITTLGALCAVVPDFDVVGFGLGIKYEDMLGHRGLSHSLPVAAVMATLALLVALVSVPPPRNRGLIWLYLFLATASHGLLDTLTNGGLGVALWAPFSGTRYFFPYTPIEVSPLGLDFFSEWGLQAAFSELRWVWLPSALFVAVAMASRRYLAARST